MKTLRPLVVAVVFLGGSHASAAVPTGASACAATTNIVISTKHPEIDLYDLNKSPAGTATQEQFTCVPASRFDTFMLKVHFNGRDYLILSRDVDAPSLQNNCKQIVKQASATNSETNSDENEVTGGTSGLGDERKKGDKKVRIACPGTGSN